MQSFDVVIVGGGIVGLTLACGLLDYGIKIAIIENSPPQNNLDVLNQIPSGKVSAINKVSCKLLKYLGVWQKIVQTRISYCQHIEILQQDSIGCIYLNAKEYYLNALGYIIENSIIRRSLWLQAQLNSDITFLTESELKKVVWNNNKVFLVFNNNQILTTKLVVGADGAKSWLRKEAGIPLIFFNYEYSALVATIRTELPHMYTARQYFNRDSILAFLPLYDPFLCSIVWSLPTIQAYKFLDLNVCVFEKKLSVASNLYLGLCKLISKRQIFPLTCQYAQSFVGQRTVLIGDAAHTIHPLAGQGVNLGLMDVAELIGQIRYLNIAGKDIGQHSYLLNYERKRKRSAIFVLSIVHILQQLFSGNNLIKTVICDVGLFLVNTVPNIKVNLLNYALGLHDIPKWLKNIMINSLEVE